MTAIINAFFVSLVLTYIGALSTGQFSCFYDFFWSTVILFAFAPVVIVQAISTIKWLWCTHGYKTRDKEKEQ
jgi:hypothetical protein